MTSRVAVWVAIAFAIVFAVPLIYLLGLFTSISSFRAAISDPKLAGLLVQTFYPGLVASIISTGTAVVYAWIVHRTDVPGRRLLALLPFLGLTTPSEVKAIGLYFMFHPRVGFFNVAFEQLFHVNFPLFNVLTVNGLILANGIGGFPFHYLLLTAAIRTFDPSLEDSARITGSSIFRTFTRVTMPSLTIPLIIVYIQGIIITASTFDYAFIFGSVTGSGINILATTIFDAVSEDIPPNYSYGADLSVVYLIFTIALVTLYIYYVRKQRYQGSSSSAVRYTPYTLSPRNKALALLICAVILLVTIVMIPSMIILVSLLPAYAYGVSLFSNLSLVNYSTLLFSGQYPLFWVALQNSVMVAIVSSVVATLVAPFIVYAIYRTKSRLSGVFEYFNFIPIAIPGVVYGLALLVVFLRVRFLADYIYGTIWAPLIVLIITWLPFAIRLQAGSAVYIKKDVEEAAFVTGSSWVRMFRRVFMPMLSAGLFVSLGYIFVDSFRELGSVYLLTSSSSYLLPIFIADEFNSTAADFGIISAVSTIMMLIAIVAIVVVDRISGGRFLLRAET